MENYDYQFTAAIPYVNCLNSLRHSFRTQNPDFLQPKHNGFVRSFTLEENALARVTTFNSETDARLKNNLFGIPLDSCTAVVYKKEDSSKFKIIPLCEQLLVPHSLQFQVEDYHSVEQEEFDTKYIRKATLFQDIPKNPVWRTAFANNEDLLRAYCDIASSINTSGMYTGVLQFSLPETAPRDRRLYALRLIEAPFADVYQNDLSESTYLLYRMRKK